MFHIGNLSWLKSAVPRDKTTLIGGHSDSDAADSGANDAVVLVNGALVNISSVLQNLNKSEEDRAQMENEFKNMEQECGVYRVCSQHIT